MRTKPSPGDKYHAGIIIREDGHMGRHIAVLFKCAHCKKGVGRARFACLRASPDKNYQTKSCGCRERACFDNYHRKRANALETGTVKMIFESYAAEYAGATATRFGISKYLANAVWQRWCRHLESLPELYRGEVYETCQWSVQRASKRFGLTAAELLRICFHWRRTISARAAEVQYSNNERQIRRAEAQRLFQLHAPIGSLTGSVYNDAKLYMEAALELSQQESFEMGRYSGELTSKEYSMGKRRSDYAWVYKMLISMYPFQIKECFGPLGDDFTSLCKWSLASRRRRQKDFLARHILPEGKKGTNPGPRRRVRYLPRPSTSPPELASLIVDSVPALTIN